MTVLQYHSCPGVGTLFDASGLLFASSDLLLFDLPVVLLDNALVSFVNATPPLLLAGWADFTPLSKNTLVPGRS